VIWRGAKSLHLRSTFIIALSVTATAWSLDDVKTVPEPEGVEPPIAAAGPPKAAAASLAVEAKKDAATELKSEGAPKDDAPQYSLSWANGLEFISKKKDFRYHVGGRMHLVFLAPF